MQYIINNTLLSTPNNLIGIIVDKYYKIQNLPIEFLEPIQLIKSPTLFNNEEKMNDWMIDLKNECSSRSNSIKLGPKTGQALFESYQKSRLKSKNFPPFVFILQDGKDWEKEVVFARCDTIFTIHKDRIEIHSRDMTQTTIYI
jgi:hypothetical protein